ncbi:MAG: MerR family transcriptional regulator [Sarcina sp.]
MKIGEISKKVGISEYTLRFYEKKGLIRVERDEFGRRVYNEKDIEWIIFIKKLKDTGMILCDIKKYSDLRYTGESTIKQRKEMLIKHRESIIDEIDKWKIYLENIDNKIEIYDKGLKQKS